METFGWTDRFCSLPGGPAGAGPCLPLLVVAPGPGCRRGHGVRRVLLAGRCPSTGKKVRGMGCPLRPQLLGALGVKSWPRVRGAWMRRWLGRDGTWSWGLCCDSWVRAGSCGVL